MDKALVEALAALRVLGDPASALGDKRGMEQFARAARERVLQMHRNETHGAGETKAA
jgi:hypothetical protein